jgi:hypothetical protein
MRYGKTIVAVGCKLIVSRNFPEKRLKNIRCLALYFVTDLDDTLLFASFLCPFWPIELILSRCCWSMIVFLLMIYYDLLALLVQVTG